MAVDLDKLEDADLRRPDPNYKPDPAARGDLLAKDVAPTEEEVEEEPVVEEEPTEEVEEEAAPEEDDKAKKEAAEEEEADDEDDEDDDDKRKHSKSVPYSRFRKTREQVKSLTSKLEQMEAQLTELRSETKNTAESKEVETRQARVEALYEEIEEQRALGNTKDAAKLQRELDTLRGEMSRAEVRRMTLEQAVRTQQVAVFNTTLAQIEAVFPELVQDADEFDEELVQDLEDTIRGYEKLGMPMTEALQRASRRILRYDPMARGKAAYLKGFAGKIPGEKAPEAPPAKKEPAAPPAVKKTDVKKNVDAAKRQPTDPADDTNDVQSKLDMAKLKPDDYRALPASVRAKLRGDTVSSA